VPGKYYSIHTGAQGAIQYILNNKAYNAKTQYYTLADLIPGNYIKGESAEEVSGEDVIPSDWFKDGELVP
jgi:hypothetical protein